MKRITMVIAGLGGRGHDIYGNYAMEHPDEVEIAAVADPRPERLELAQREWNIPAERCFATAEELFAQPRWWTRRSSPRRTGSMSSMRRPR